MCLTFWFKNKELTLVAPPESDTFYCTSVLRTHGWWIVNTVSNKAWPFSLFFNRNSAPEIVVTREGLPRQPLSVPATGASSSMLVHPATAPGPPPVPPNCTGSGSSPAHGRRPTNRIEDRINRARARVWQTGQSTQSSISPGSGAGNMNSRYGHSNNSLWFSLSLLMPPLKKAKQATPDNVFVFLW